MKLRRVPLPEVNKSGRLKPKYFSEILRAVPYECVLIGGQAVVWWAERYGIKMEVRGKEQDITSRDINFWGSSAEGKAAVQYVDRAYVSAQRLAQAQAEGREIIGPALPGPLKRAGSRRRIFALRWRSAPPFARPGAQHPVSRLVEESTGKVNSVLNSAPSVTIACCALNASPKVSDIARYWWGSITPYCTPGARSNRPTLSSTV